MCAGNARLLNKENRRPRRKAELNYIRALKKGPVSFFENCERKTKSRTRVAFLPIFRRKKQISTDIQYAFH